MFDLLLQTKLSIPAAQSSRVVRQRLLDRLDLGSTRRLCLVSAPAGYGKTTLVAAWTQTSQRRIAWVSLDQGDNEPTRFMAYLLAALQTLQPEAESTPGALPQQHLPTLGEAALIHLLNEINRRGIPLSLVLDDYHVITEPRIHEAVAFVLDNMPPNMNLTILTRQDPPLPLSRLRAREQITEIRQADLRFTLGEAAAFLSTHTSLSLTDTDVMALETRTEGWAAGLQLAAIALQSAQTGPQADAHGLVQSITGGNRFVFDYLVDEVLARQPAIIRDFMLQTSVLDRLNGSLCDSVLELDSRRPAHQVPDHPSFVFQAPITSRQILEYLEQLNLFVVPLDNDRQWYRYHSLFADLLRQQLGQSADEQAIAGLHGRASLWYEANGLPIQAIEHALAATDYLRTARLIEVHGQRAVWEHSLYVTVTRWLDALPDGLIASNPGLAILHAVGLVFVGQLPAAEKRLQAAEQAMVALPADQQRVLMGQIIVARLFVTGSFSLEEGAVGAIEQALAQIPLDDAYSRGSILAVLGNAYRTQGKMDQARQTLAQAMQLSEKAGNVAVAVLAANMLGAAERAQGRLDQAMAHCRRAQEISAQTVANEPSLMGITLLALAEVQYQRNELDTALDTLTRGIQLVTQSDTITRQHALTGYITLARIRQAQGDYRAAEQALAQAPNPTSSPQLAAMAAAQRAWLNLAEGNNAAAGRWADNVRIAPEKFVARSLDEEICTLARVRIAQGQPETALDLLASVRTTAEADGRTGDLMEIAILQACAFQAQGHLPAALEAIGPALALGKAEGYVRLFLDEGPAVAALLRQAIRAGVEPAYAAQLLALFPVYGEQPEPATAAQPLPDPLSARELEVLRLLASGYSNADIADKLVVTVGTVKTHTSHIYNKLVVRNRAEAVRRALELKLV